MSDLNLFINHPTLFPEIKKNTIYEIDESYSLALGPLPGSGTETLLVGEKILSLGDGHLPYFCPARLYEKQYEKYRNGDMVDISSASGLITVQAFARGRVLWIYEFLEGGRLYKDPTQNRFLSGILVKRKT